MSPRLLFIFRACIVLTILLVTLGGLAFSINILYNSFYSLGPVHTRYTLLNIAWAFFAQISMCGIILYALATTAGCLYVIVEIIKMFFFDKDNS